MLIELNYLKIYQDQLLWKTKEESVKVLQETKLKYEIIIKTIEFFNNHLTELFE
jgi:hypothetical protein